ncbi:DUF2125 domain-containing protein [Rhodobacter sphaeroides]|jgi:hypothetical protein|uniref:DUF2125 domain-containing protein n=1 Tax=Cereibacter sphaeroides (strain ATCC 17023 / DSM 158 / JCM 6121 / CCUG 31486 / LMG 2827 / NBRC 12203 / NCIMB 8253 / ATH 2.4.1.) TaxID=272943 RepID=Q3IZD7_CERS4|nr:DUF2125 domain-containing protein [Cereibacter sphaeroides]ABA80097.1 hypothetical protein RSP_0915 [Cereibacter sphaeroides 2.4.1]AMJ48345.1 hypothetical protein APX01_12625 [Cereibacter sphaeroides]ANS35064.1 hypothetical protein A3858_12660 [Cereibacter sphaeroides]ATN64114.1 hypothetical protein A3857_12655 [Cereibacter sphaeroides]AXC62294.1 DUF2125 domain-containing protein [Cereibacter sphaeroides 2.4.1]
MTYFSTLAGTTALATLVAAGSAQADVTPEQVWQSWQELGATYGQTLTAANQSRTGDTLKLQDVRMHFAQDGTVVEGTIPEVNLTQRGDGTVEITMSPEFPVEMTIPNEPDAENPAPEPTELALALRQPGMVMVAGGDDLATTLAFDAPSTTIAVTEVDGVSAREMNLTAEMTMSDVAGTYRTEGTDTRSITNDFTAAVAEMTFAMTDPETKGKVNVRASATDLKGTSSGKMVGTLGMADMAAALQAGAASTGSFTYGPATLEFDFADATDKGKGSASAAGGNLDVSMSGDSLSYGGGTKNVSLTLSGSQIPFPQFNMSYAEAAFQLLTPVTTSEEPQDFRLLTRLVNFKVSDEIWAMFDPQAQLPRDPATLVLDAKGKARLDIDLLDPKQVETLGEKAPGQIEALDLDQLQLTIAGADLTGDGSLTFDNSDTTTFGGVPAPTGQIDLKLVGGNALIDKLVSIGIVPQDQAMAARMMLGLFARPGEGEDTLTSTLEFKDKGFYANGQRLQ